MIDTQSEDDMSELFATEPRAVARDRPLDRVVKGGIIAVGAAAFIAGASFLVWLTLWALGVGAIAGTIGSIAWFSQRG